MSMNPDKAACSVLILAAGQGTRMKSSRPKMLHPLSNKWMVSYILETARKLSPLKIYLLTGHRGEALREALAREKVIFLEQKIQKGTGHAVLCALKAIPKKHLKGHLLVVNGDAPLLRAGTVKRLFKAHTRTGAVLSLLTCRLDNPFGYGRIIRDRRGRILKIIEEKSATMEEKKQKEINVGLYCLSLRDALSMLKKIRADEKTGEFYLTDLPAIAIQEGKRVTTVSSSSPDEILGINSHQDLAHVQRIFWRRKSEQCMASGVRILAPEWTFIDCEAVIGPETVIHPGVTIIGRTIIGKSCTIGQGVTLSHSKIGDHTTISANARIHHALINPGGFAR